MFVSGDSIQCQSAKQSMCQSMRARYTAVRPEVDANPSFAASERFRKKKKYFEDGFKIWREESIKPYSLILA